MQNYNLKILVEGQQLDYETAENVGIQFNRIVDDAADLSARLGEFSFSFDVPQTKSNNRIFRYANTKGIRNVFPDNRNLNCQVFNNEQLIIDGILNLNSVGKETYSVTIFSKFKEFIDAIDGKNLQELNLGIINNYDYEKDLIRVLKAEYTGSTQNLYVYPLVYYSTPFTPYSVYSGLTDNRGTAITREDTYQNFYYTVNNNVDNNCYTYHHQVPMAIFLMRVVEQVFIDAGFRVSSPLFDDRNFQRMVMLYTGDDDVYDRATGQVSGSTATYLNPAIFLPDIDQEEFIKGFFNMFNCYFKLDVGQKMIYIDTWNNLFGDVYNPYDMTNKIFADSVVFSFQENSNPSIMFAEIDNFKTMADSFISTGHTDNATEMTFVKYDDKNLNQFFNRVGDNDSDIIELPFSVPMVKRHMLWNKRNKAGTNNYCPAQQIFIPAITAQTPNDNDNKAFNKDITQSNVFNNESGYKFGDGQSPIMYWYGTSNATFVNHSTKGAASDYYYVNIPTGGTFYRTSIGFCSPFQLIHDQGKINNYMDVADVTDRRTITGTYLRTIYTMMGTGTTETDFSLVFDDNGYFHTTLWQKFHKNKYDRYQTGMILEATTRMSSYDFNELQIDRPVLYNGEIYHLLAIEGYSPITEEATIRLIKSI